MTHCLKRNVVSCSCSNRVTVAAPRKSQLCYRLHSRGATVRALVSADQSAELDLPPERPDAKDAVSPWARLQLLRRQQDVAVAEENYAMAAALRDEVRTQVSSLPPVQQYLYRQVSVLRTGQLAEKMQAIRAMVEAGDAVVIPELASCLADRELADMTFEAMWSLFMRNSDPEINSMMIEGIQLMSSASTQERALAIFTDMIQRAPNFPEAYNKRATVLYAMKRFEDSIADCRAVLRMQPWHFGAASGMGLCYLMLSRENEAAEAFELALSIHPGMNDISRVLNELKKRIAKTAAAATITEPALESTGSSSGAKGSSEASGAGEARPSGRGQSGSDADVDEESGPGRA